MDPYAIDIDACRGRQQRLLEAIEPLGIDLIVLTRRESVQWLTGAYVRAPFEPIAAMTSAGHLTLVLPERQANESAAADEVVGYEAKWHSTTRDDQRAASSAALSAKLASAPKRVACEFEAFAPHLLLSWNAPLVEIDAIAFELRRRKDADELRMLSRANQANRAMYEHARRIVRPGVNELDVYAELHAVAVRTLGEPLTYFGQDFRAGARGGPPRDRQAQAGELMILDLGVGFRGYHSDNARTIAVGGEPTERQQRAWEAVAAVFGVIESAARPGASCRELFNTVQRQLDGHRPWVFNHHLGHGVGLAPQEGPHLNPRWDDTLAEGDFIAVEPGLYHEELRAGVRLEQNYLVTRNGLELVTDWPLEL
ncbi:MAG: Xaa-Pro peptidase family protein [Pirellulales bacterium]